MRLAVHLHTTHLTEITTETGIKLAASRKTTGKQHSVGFQLLFVVILSTLNNFGWQLCSIVI